MDRESSGPDVEAFLQALSDELRIAPDDLLARRQVSAAAALARSAQVRHQRVRIMVRKVAAVAGALSIAGTGGLATAGALPAPIQDAVAQVAEVIPLPIYVPYPEIEDPQAPESSTVVVGPAIIPESPAPPATPTPKVSPRHDGDSAGCDECGDHQRDDPADWSGSSDRDDKPGDVWDGGSSNDADHQSDDGQSDDGQSGDGQSGDDQSDDGQSGDDQSDAGWGAWRDDGDGGADDRDDGQLGPRSEDGSTQGSSWVGP